MATREIFRAKLLCPTCKTTGMAECEDDVSPHNPDRTIRIVVAVSEGFQGGGYLDGAQQIICSRCRSLVPV
jgi:hypothetical protein